jgi:hypothetical protein
MLNTVRFSFYALLMMSLHAMDSGAGVHSALRQIKELQHYRETGIL